MPLFFNALWSPKKKVSPRLDGIWTPLLITPKMRLQIRHQGAFLFLMFILITARKKDPHTSVGFGPPRVVPAVPADFCTSAYYTSY